ncbi:MerR family transcriptional regulator [Alkalicoccobacillus murimartini]|uniref:DNA-binding transcriptional MerR regulator n=1 Tax=Alkalicoccobacillus murimartini TaxID=171685 RepID=A0ABT9YDE4_9BACI|nr:MerR family transcriptional regulator [Alkalicoccobacillus murimartini]MDQ0205883.1 DNA-binding transcriptional MerR regulator [Alkalicoccobacillus murimartini]
MTPSDGKYNIKAISTKLGVQPGTLRAWERRYKVIEPSRNAAGHRLYSEQQLHVLNWLINKVEQGFTIGQAVDLIDLERLTDHAEPKNHHEQYTDQLASDIQDALLAFNECEASQLLNKAFSLYSIEKVARDILGTVFRQVRDLREQDKVSSAHEYMAISFIEAKIKHILVNLPIDRRLPKVVTVLYGHHKRMSLEWLLYTLFLRHKGFEVIYLGEGLSTQDVELVLREVKPGLFFSFCQDAEQLDEMTNFVMSIDDRFPKISIGIGGEECIQVAETQRFFIGTEQVEWEEWLKNWFATN